jgi:hypothetical protein
MSTQSLIERAYELAQGAIDSESGRVSMGPTLAQLSTTYAILAQIELQREAMALTAQYRKELLAQ